MVNVAMRVVAFVVRICADDVVERVLDTCGCYNRENVRGVTDQRAARGRRR